MAVGLHGDFGVSFRTGEPVTDFIVRKWPITMAVAFLAVLIAVPLGVAKAVRAGSKFDLITSVLVLVGYAIPGFVLGVVLLVVAAFLGTD